MGDERTRWGSADEVAADIPSGQVQHGDAMAGREHGRAGSDQQTSPAAPLAITTEHVDPSRISDRSDGVHSGPLARCVCACNMDC